MLVATKEETLDNTLIKKKKQKKLWCSCKNLPNTNTHRVWYVFSFDFKWINYSISYCYVWCHILVVLRTNNYIAMTWIEFLCRFLVHSLVPIFKKCEYCGNSRIEWWLIMEKTWHAYRKQTHSVHYCYCCGRGKMRNERWHTNGTQTLWNRHHTHPHAYGKRVIANNGEKHNHTNAHEAE